MCIFADQPTVTTFTTGTPGNSVVQGTMVTLTCSANGYPPPTYTLKRGNTTVNSVGGTFLVPVVQISEENENYTCEPRNKAGSGPTKELKITVKGWYPLNFRFRCTVTRSLLYSINSL